MLNFISRYFNFIDELLIVLILFWPLSAYNPLFLTYQMNHRDKQEKNPIDEAQILIQEFSSLVEPVDPDG